MLFVWPICPIPGVAKVRPLYLFLLWEKATNTSTTRNLVKSCQWKHQKNQIFTYFAEIVTFSSLIFNSVARVKKNNCQIWPANKKVWPPLSYTICPTPLSGESSQMRIMTITTFFLLSVLVIFLVLFLYWPLQILCLLSESCSLQCMIKVIPFSYLKGASQIILETQGE